MQVVRHNETDAYHAIFVTNSELGSESWTKDMSLGLDEGFIA